MRHISRTALFSLILAACGGSDDPADIPDDTDGPTQTNEEVSVEIGVYPKVPSPGGLITVGVNAFGNFEFVDPDDNSTPVAGEGHYIIYMDGQSHEMFLYGHAPGQAGKYMLSVELVGNDGTPLDPPVTNELELTVE